MTEVETARNIAAVQLERVRMQMAENIRPLHYALAVVNGGVHALGAQLSLSWGCAVFGRDFADVCSHHRGSRTSSSSTNPR